MLIINANIITMDTQNFQNGFIRIDNGIIVEIGEMKDLAKYEDAFIDLNGNTIVPGFIDAHTHLGMWEDALGFEGADGNEDTDPSTPQLRAIDSINPMDRSFLEARLSGVTTVASGVGSSNPIGGQFCVLKTNGKRIDNIILNSSIGIKFSLGENPKNTFNSKNLSPVTRMAISAIIREQLLKAKRYLEDIQKAENDEDLDYPEYDIKCEALIPLFKKQAKAYFHAHRADDIFTAIRISKEFDLDYVLIHCTEGHLIADELKKENAKIISGPLICDRSKPELKNFEPSSVAKLFESGLECAICTDHPEIPIQYLNLSAGIAIKNGLNKLDALKSITKIPAEILGISDRVGSISVGKDADFVVFEDDIFSITSSPKMVIIKGEIIND